MTDQPQLYLITPRHFDVQEFPQTLAQVLDGHAVACVRLTLASTDESDLSRASDALRTITDARDVALVIEDHVVLADRLGLDGVHLSDAARSVRSARKALGADAIVGSFCNASRHDGMTAGEAGADYVSFGPVRETPLNDGSFAPLDLFQWWSEVIEVPVVAEGAMRAEDVAALAGVTDFLAFGDEIWSAEDPTKALADLLAPLG